MRADAVLFAKTLLGDFSRMSEHDSYKIIFPLAMVMMVASACSSSPTVEALPDEEAAALASMPSPHEISRATEVSFNHDSADLDATDRSALDDLIKTSMHEGAIGEVKVVSWADQSYSKESLKDPMANLPSAQKKLADQRSTKIKDYIKESYPTLDVQVYNMAKRPGAFQELYQSSDARTQQSFENAGFKASEADMNPPAKTSKALVLSILKK
jgi:hypothetical protein